MLNGLRKAAKIISRKNWRVRGREAKRVTIQPMSRRIERNGVMKIEGLQRVLQRISTLYGAAGAKGPANDVQLIIKMLDEHGDEEIENFVRDTSDGLGEALRPRPSSGADQGVVNKHSERLLAAGVSKSEFEHAMLLVNRDKQVGKLEWVAIANVYLNSPTNGSHSYKYKTIKEARTAIENVFTERFEAPSKAGIIQELTDWLPTR